MVTNADYTVNFKHYGEITVPAGTRLTHQTACGIDKKIHFVDSMNWIDRNYPLIASTLKHDVKYRGINVPVEYVDYQK